MAASVLAPVPTDSTAVDPSPPTVPSFPGSAEFDAWGCGSVPAWAGAARFAAAGAAAALHRRTGRRHGVPDAAEGVLALPLGVAGGRVAREAVQRLADVGQLATAVAALDGGLLARAHATASLRARGRLGGRPVLGAGAGAVAVILGVLPEHVERAAAAVD